jgi:hypothetical protein
LFFVVFGTTVEASAWAASFALDVVVTTGAAMLAALPIILGIQLLLPSGACDVASSPTTAIRLLMEEPGWRSASVRSARD